MVAGPGSPRTRSDADCRHRSRALAPRCSPLPMASTCRTSAATAAARSPSAAALASNRGRSMPLRRVLAARAGTGTTATRTPSALAAWPSAGAMCVAALSAASAKKRSRSRLPLSFHATTIEWLGPTSSVIAHTGKEGLPSMSSLGASDSDLNGGSHHGAAQSSHQRTSWAPHPGHATGTMSRATSRMARDREGAICLDVERGASVMAPRCGHRPVRTARLPRARQRAAGLPPGHDVSPRRSHPTRSGPPLSSTCFLSAPTACHLRPPPAGSAPHCAP